MKKLIFFFTVCLFMYSCDKNKYHAISQDKIPSLKNNDTLYFQDSASSKIDTFRIEIKEIWRQSLEDGTYQYIEIYYNKPNSKSPFLGIYITSLYVSSNLNFQIDNYYSQMSLYYRIRNQVTIQGVTYPTVYEMFNRDYYHLYPDSIPDKMDYTYNKGIIRYGFKDGSVHELINKQMK